MHYKEVRSILSAQNGMNLYRGCTHGCIYCDSRSRCYQIKHDFEDVEIKINAPALLEAELRRRRNKCMISTGAMCDSYIPLEAELRHTRRCIELIDRYGFGLAIQSKSASILRDLDVFKSIHRKAKCVVEMTLTTYDEALCRILEPNVSTTRERFEALKIFRDEGIPTVVWLSPLLPYLTDTEENLLGILDYCAEAKVYGIIMYGIGMTLREGDREYFYAQLDKHFPGLSLRYHRRYGNRYEIPSDNQDMLLPIFYDFCEKKGIVCDNDAIFSYMHVFPKKEEAEQLSFADW